MPLYRVFLSLFATTALCGFASQAHGQSWSQDQRVIEVHQAMQSQSLDLLWLAGINSYHDRGMTIDSVEVEVYNSDQRSSLVLIADGQIQSQEPVNFGNVMLYPARTLQVGYSFQNLSLAVRGFMYVNRVILNVSGGGPGHHHPPPIEDPPYPPQPVPQPPAQNEITVDANINMNFQGSEQFEIGAQANLYQYVGYRIASIEIEGTSQANQFAQVSVIENSLLVGSVVLNNYQSSQTIYPQMSLLIGNNVGAVQARVQGNLWLSRIRFRLTKY